MKTQLFSRPDLYIGACGSLKADVNTQAIPGAPAFMRGMKALLVTDIHVLPGTKDSDIGRLVSRIIALHPDILLLGGDISDSREDAERFFKAVKGCEFPLGIYAAPGNNDREAWEDTSLFAKCAESAGIRVLVNESVCIDMGGNKLYIAGVDEHLRGNPDARGLYPENGGDDRYRILISHYPCVPAAIPDLMVCGHTHGGQFNAFGITPYAVGFERMDPKAHRSVRIEGLAGMNEGLVYVSKGIGASRIQLRVGVRPQMDMLTF